MKFLSQIIRARYCRGEACLECENCEWIRRYKWRRPTTPFAKPRKGSFAMLGTTFNLQGHRGARGHKPGNTLPSFEVALDAGVTSIETDLHLTRDGQVIVIHDAKITERQCRLLLPGAAPDPASQPLVSTLTRADLAHYVADVNPDPGQFPNQDALATPAAANFAGQHLNNNPFAPADAR